MKDQRRLASSVELSEFLGIPICTLDRWAYLGTGPQYSKIGRHRRYKWQDIEAWLDRQKAGGDRDAA